MKWRVRKPGTRFRALHRWHTWFAWYPVRVPTKGSMSGMHMVWIEKIQRIGSYELTGYVECSWNWSYKKELEG